MNTIRTWGLGVTALLAACAVELPGAIPPGDQIYFPLGIAAVGGPGGPSDFIAVSSTNFDQRFNAGRLTTFSTSALFQLVASATGDPVVYRDDFAGSIVDSVRVPQFGGQLLFVPNALDGTVGQLFVPSRASDELTMVDVTVDGNLDCNAGQSNELEPVLGLDCTPSYITETGFDDPFPLAFAPGIGANGLLSVGHLRGADPRLVQTTLLSTVKLEDLRNRVTEERTGNEVADLEMIRSRPDSLSGTTGLAFLPPPALGSTNGIFLAAGRVTQVGRISVVAFEPTADEAGNIGLVEVGAVSISALLSVIDMRGLAVDVERRRAYVSVRFAEINDAYNAGIAVLSWSETGLGLLNVIEVGEELAPPFLFRGQLYVGDARTDQIYVLDVRSDDPVLVTTIQGRGLRTLEGVSTQVSTLDAPEQMVFVDRGDRALAFVTNFGNSTMAVLDVTAADPREHRVIARLGRNINANGDTEGP